MSLKQNLIVKIITLSGLSTSLGGLYLFNDITGSHPRFYIDDHNKNKAKIKLQNFGHQPFQIEDIKLKINKREYNYGQGIKEMSKLLKSSDYELYKDLTFMGILGQNDSNTLLIAQRASNNTNWTKDLYGKDIEMELKYKSVFPQSLWSEFTTVNLRLT